MEAIAHAPGCTHRHKARQQCDDVIVRLPLGATGPEERLTSEPGPPIVLSQFQRTVLRSAGVTLEVAPGLAVLVLWIAFSIQSKPDSFWIVPLMLFVAPWSGFGWVVIGWRGLIVGGALQVLRLVTLVFLLVAAFGSDDYVRDNPCFDGYVDTPAGFAAAQRCVDRWQFAFDATLVALIGVPLASAAALAWYSRKVGDPR